MSDDSSEKIQIIVSLGGESVTIQEERHENVGDAKCLDVSIISKGVKVRRIPVIVGVNSSFISACSAALAAVCAFYSEGKEFSDETGSAN